MNQHEQPHMPLAMYYKIYMALMALLILTVGAAYIHMGILNLPVAMAIALVKGVLVVLFFMHVKYTEKTIWVFAAAGFVWLAYMLVGFLMDYLSRFAG